MTFSEYWEGQSYSPASDKEKRAIAMMAWDAALCAVQAQNYDAEGRMRSAFEITATVSDLHTWNKPTTLS